MFCFRRHSYRRETQECLSGTDETNAKAAKGFITVLFHVHQILVVRHEDIQVVAVNSIHIFWQLSELGWEPWSRWAESLAGHAGLHRRSRRAVATMTPIGNPNFHAAHNQLIGSQSADPD